MVYKIDPTGVDLVAVWGGYIGDGLQPPPHSLFLLTAWRSRCSNSQTTGLHYIREVYGMPSVFPGLSPMQRHCTPIQLGEALLGLTAFIPAFLSASHILTPKMRKEPASSLPLGLPWTRGGDCRHPMVSTAPQGRGVGGGHTILPTRSDGSGTPCDDLASSRRLLGSGGWSQAMGFAKCESKQGIFALRRGSPHYWP